MCGGWVQHLSADAADCFGRSFGIHEYDLTPPKFCSLHVNIFGIIYN